MKVIKTSDQLSVTGQDETQNTTEMAQLKYACFNNGDDAIVCLFQQRKLHNYTHISVMNMAQ
jgi:hypothetical protein